MPTFSILLLTLAPVQGEVMGGHDPQQRSADLTLNPRERAIHLLSRLAYHPTPVELATVERIGIVNWVDRQLKPGRTKNPRLELRISELGGINMSPGEAFAWVQRMAHEAGELDLFYALGESVDMAQLTELEREQVRARREIARDEYQKLTNQLQSEFLGATLARAIESDLQGEEVIADFWRNHFSIDSRKGGREAAFWMPEWERHVLRGHMWGSFEEMLVATARHPAMLNYLDQAQSRRRYSTEELERFRRRAERRGASPERIEETLRRQAGSGPNENYARELLELHTLGVDNVYEQEDVVTVSEAMTGWTFHRRSDDPDEAYSFLFDGRRHQLGEKDLFGEPLPMAGEASMKQGEEILRRLAEHPSTADYVSRKLVRRLAADHEPEVLVDAAKQAWKEHDGDLTQVVRAIVLNPSFYDRELYQGKVKTPWEFVVSALRAVGAEVHAPRHVLRSLTEMGMPLYQCGVPTGWSDSAEDWLDPGAMAYRWSFAEQLVGGRMRGIYLPGGRSQFADWLVGHEAEAWPAVLADRIVPAGIGSQTTRALKQTLTDYLESRRTQRRGPRAQEIAPTLVALLLGSPEFQRQ
ncbi:MAG: DUF1800 domain-containing protein [Planctomycetes bacterium]|nr:DUF1800 domain-containing protein [Planctomycetota bacterium]